MSPVQTAEQAITRADQFISRYYATSKLLSARLEGEGESWRLVYDIGILHSQQKIEILLAAATGDVMGYGPVEQCCNPPFISDSQLER